MGPVVLTEPGEVPLEVEEQIDRICLRFEQGWQGGHTWAVASLLAEVADDWRPALFRELIRIELDYRETARLDEYIENYPEFADVVRSVFPDSHVGAKERTGSSPARMPGFERANHPDQVGSYRILRELGRGGMGVVYKAIQASLGRQVALKVLAPIRGGEREVERFRREAEVAARLHHTNIVPIYEAGQDGDLRYYAMQYIRGRDLYQFIERARQARGEAAVGDSSLSADSPGSISTVSSLPVTRGERHELSEETSPALGTEAGDHISGDVDSPSRPGYFRRVAAMGAQVASALAYAHGQGVVHRDIKPTNLLLDSRETVWITDFGLVKTSDSDLTSRGDIVGTLRYLPPERLRGVCDFRSDIYSLGLTLYELTTLKPAFPDIDHIELIEAIHNREPSAPRSLDSRVPRDLETITLKAIRKRPQDRYQHATELAEDLRRFLAGEPTLARPLGPLERAWIWSRRRPGTAMGIALFCGALVLIAVMSIMLARAARRHAADLSEALVAVRKSEATARESDLTARRHESQALDAKGQSNRVAARLALSNAISLAEKGSVDRALFAMLHALEIDPPEADEEPFRRVIRMNLAAWSRQTAALRYAFHLPDAGRANKQVEHRRDDGVTRQLFLSRAGDQGQFLTIGADRIARHWSFGSGTSIGPPVPITRMGFPMSVSDDGKWLATSGTKNELQNLATGAIARAPVKPHAKNGAPTFTPMSLLAAGVITTTSDNPADHGCARFCDEATGREFRLRMRFGRGDCYEVIAGKDGQPLLFVSRIDQAAAPEPRLEAWDLRTGVKLTVPYPLADNSGTPGSQHRGRYFVALPRGETLRTQLYTERDGPVCSWDLDTGKLASPPWTSPVAPAYQLLTGEGRVLAAQSRDDRIRLFDLDSGRQLGGTLTIPQMASPYFPTKVSVGMAVSPDGTVLVTLEADGTLRGWDVRDLLEQSRQAQRSCQSHLPPAVASSTAEPVVALAPDGSRAFFGRGDEGRVIDTKTGQPLGPPIRHPLLYRAHFSPDGNFLATATTASPLDEPPIVRIWDLRGHDVALYGAPEYIHGLRFSPDGRRLAVACVYQTTVLEVPNGKMLWTFEERSCAVNTAFSPDGRLLAVGYRGGWPGLGAGLRIWDVRTGKPASEFHRCPEGVEIAQTVEFVFGGNAVVALDSTTNQVRRFRPTEPSDSGTRLGANRPTMIATRPGLDLVAIADAGGALEVWNIVKGQRRWVAPSSGDVRRLKLSSDGNTLAVVDSDRSIRLWDTETGWTLGPPLAHPDDIADLTFSADGQTLVTATISGQVFRSGVPSPMAGGLPECTAAIHRKLGLASRSGELVLMPPDEWQSLATARRP